MAYFLFPAAGTTLALVPSSIVERITMANKSLFASLAGCFITPANTVNEAGGAAYALSPKEQLAQLAVTGCLSTTFYATAESQLAKVIELATAKNVSPEFVAKTAVYARRHAFMKDMPALLCAVLASWQPDLLERTFNAVINDAKMLRNFVQIIRSGAVGRKSLGSLPKRLVKNWIASRTNEQLLRGSVGAQPSLADVIRMVHPKPADKSQAALFAYLIGRDHDPDALPELVKQLEAFRSGASPEVPDVPFQLLTSTELSTQQWKQIARQAPWQTLRMNLNTFLRHGVLEDAALVNGIVERLTDKAAIRESRVFPYQLMTAFLAADKSLPPLIRLALQDAMEIATDNVPALTGKVCVCLDVSGSMHSAITGHRKGSTSAARCVDVASLFAACIARKNPTATIIPFKENIIQDFQINPRDSVMTNAQKMSSLPPGGTDCAAPLRHLNSTRANADTVIFVSDNESWISPAQNRGTATMAEWTKFKRRNPSARLVCIDLQPYTTTQAVDTGSGDVLNVGGFSDEVFNVVSRFARGEDGAQSWIKQIEAVRF